MLRFYGKKRGHRRTGSKWAATAGEALFSAALLVVGAAGLVGLLSWTVVPNWQTEGSNWWVWPLLSIPGSCLLIGGGGLILTLLHGWTSAEHRKALIQRAAQLDPFEHGQEEEKQFPTVPAAENLTNSPGTRLAYRLPVDVMSSWRLAGTALFSLITNGTTILFGTLAVNRHLDGRPDWLLDVFVLMLVAASAYALVLLMRQLRTTGGMGPTLVEVSDHPLRPGQQYEVLVSQAGRLTLDWLDAQLVCQEEASYQQGTDVRTERQTVFQQQVFRCENVQIEPGQPLERQCRLHIPHGVMHSFKADYNEVRWDIVVRAEAAGWPRLERAFPVVVHPPPVRSTAP
jgi:hypothetical protein